LKQGIYKITNENYHQHFCDVPTLSTGVIKDLLDSPARCWFNHPKLNPDYVKPEHERKFDLGSAVHDYVLERAEHIEVINGFDDWKTKKARELADEATKAGKIPLLEKQCATVSAISVSIIRTILNCAELMIDNLNDDGEAELTYVWNENGVWLKTRPDWISKDKKLILDLKTVGQSANPNEFSNKAVSLGYDTQSALYRRGSNAINGIEPEFVFIVVEIEPPYMASVVSLSAEFQELGRQKVESAIGLWRWCLRNNKWPGYETSRIAWCECKPYHISDWENKKYDINQILGGK